MGRGMVTNSTNYPHPYKPGEIYPTFTEQRAIWQENDIKVRSVALNPTSGRSDYLLFEVELNNNYTTKTYSNFNVLPMKIC